MLGKWRLIWSTSALTMSLVAYGMTGKYASAQAEELNQGMCDEHTSSTDGSTTHWFGQGACYVCGPNRCHSATKGGYCLSESHTQCGA
jgi:hypothetical protein